MSARQKLKASVSDSMCLVGLAAAINAALDTTGAITTNPINATQAALMENISTPDALKATKLPTIAAICGRDKRTLSKFAKHHAMDIAVGNLAPTNELIALSVFDLDAKWQHPGEAVRLKLDTKRYHFAKFKKFEEYQVAGYWRTFALTTEQGYTVWLGCYGDAKPPNRGKLSAKAVRSEFTAVQVPMIDFTEQADISALLGLRISDYYISQAQQLNKIKLNETAIRVKSDTRLELKKSMVRENIFTIDAPFHLWITHTDSRNFVLIRAAIGYQHFKRPK